MIRDNINRLYDSVDSIKSRLGIKDNIKIMAVTKMHSAEEVLEVIKSGQLLLGENRIPEAHQKYTSDTLAGMDYSLHIIGHLQRNKVKKALEISSMIQSIDKIETLDVIENAANQMNKKIDFLLEVNTSFETQKHGVLPDDFLDLLENVLKKSYLFCNLRGLMTVAPFTDDKNKIRESFSNLKKLFDKTKLDLKKSDFDILSMGMSGDYEIAIEEGSNMLRVGSLIFS